LLGDHGVPGIYRAQRSFGPNRTRMQTSPAPHEGLGVDQYAWSTSPLRRYVDLVNQWQLLACAEHGVAAKLVAPFKPKDADLYAALQSFDETYSAYADYQNKMETFWCLRWLKQEKRDRMSATVIKGDLVRLEEIPLVLHVPGLGVHPRGTRVLLDVVSIDELTVEASTRLVQVLDAPVASDVADADEGEDDEGDQAASAEVERAEGDEDGAMVDEAQSAAEEAAGVAADNAAEANSGKGSDADADAVADAGTDSDADADTGAGAKAESHGERN
jgi:exoribonuclease-2